MKYMNDRLGFVCKNDFAWVMDDYGQLVNVPFSLPQWYFQEV